MFKRYLAALLAFILSLSSFSLAFSAAVSIGDRVVDLSSYQSDGSYSNTNDKNNNIYSVQLLKSTTLTNKFKITYRVDPMSEESDMPATIKLFIPNATVDEDAKVETNNLEAIDDEIGVVTNGNGTTVSITVMRDKLFKLDYLELIVPFKLNKLTGEGNATVTLVSPTGQNVSYDWGIDLKEPEATDNKSLKERLDANTKFDATMLKANAGIHYVIPLNVQSIADEKSVTVKVSNSDFYFKLQDGSWVEGIGNYTATNLTADRKEVIPVEVFCLRDTTTSFTLSAEGEQLTKTLPVKKGTISVTDIGTDTSLPINTSGNLIMTFRYDEPLVSNNQFKFEVTNYESSFYTIDMDTAKTVVDSDNMQAVFSAKYTPKKTYSNKALKFDITQKFNNVSYTLGSKDVSLSAVESSEVKNDISIAAELRTNNTIALTVTNNGNKKETIPVCIAIDTDKINITTDSEIQKVSGNYIYSATVMPTESLTKILNYTVDDDCNTTSEDKIHTVMFTIPNAVNVKSSVDIVVPGVAAEANLAITGFQEIGKMDNGQTKTSFVTVENTSAKDIKVSVNLKVSNPKVTLESSVQTWRKIDETTYTFTKEIKGKSSVDAPFSVSVDPKCNTEKNPMVVSISAESSATNPNVTSNKKVMYITINPDEEEQKPTLIDLNDYFKLSFETNNIERMEKAIVTLKAEQLKPLPEELKNGTVHMEVVGDVLEQPVTGNYVTEKKVSKLDISTIANTIVFTPTNVGIYKVLATVTCDNLKTGGELDCTHSFIVAADSGAYPSVPIISSDAVLLNATLSDIQDNKATLSLTVENKTDYILRSGYLHFDYSECINILRDSSRQSEYTGLMKAFKGSAIVRNELFIGNLPPKTSKEYRFPVEILSSGKMEIDVSLTSTDLNTNAFKPNVKLSKDVVFDKETDEVPTETYDISGMVFNDKNKNSVMNADEDSIANATVFLKEPTGNVLKSVRTNSSGYYIFSGVAPGKYVLSAEYISATATKDIAVMSNNINNVNIPIILLEDNNGINNGNNNGGNNTTNGENDILKANVDIVANIKDITEDYYVIEVVVNNRSQVSTWASVAASFLNVKPRTSNNWAWEGEVYRTEKFFLAAFDSTSFTLYVDRADLDGSSSFTVEPLTDTTISDNQVSVAISAFNRGDSFDNSDDYNTTSKDRNEYREYADKLTYGEDIIDFSNTTKSDTVQQLAPKVATPASPSKASQSDDSVSHVLPKTGEVSYFDSILGDFTSAICLAAGLLFLCTGLYILIANKKDAKN